MRQKAHSAQRTVSSGTPKNVRKKFYYIYNKYYFYILLLYKVICTLNKLCAVRCAQSALPPYERGRDFLRAYFAK